MLLKRCAVTFVELDQEPRFDLASVLGGGNGVDRSPRWLAHAPHLREPVVVDTGQLAVLQRISRDEPASRADLEAAHGEATIRTLLAAGLLLGDESDPDHLRRDTNVREVPWWGPALIAQNAGGWDDIDVQALREHGGMPDSAQLVRENGPAPVHEYRRDEAGGVATALAAPARSGFDDLLAQRRTCRNFDGDAELSARDLATMLHRVWGAVGTLELSPGAVAVKKTSPAGGGLHSVEAYVLVQRAEGVVPGLHHYLPLQHALEPVRPTTADEAAQLVRRFVSGQEWFFDVPVLVVMTARFDRLFWKYRRHAKAWRVVHLDVGHLSQTMYLSAADLGLGAFVTAAINDRAIEEALALAPLREGAIAIVGFGPRSPHRRNIEFDGLTPTAAARLAAG
jgi:putative peptide maturation dehydrogenase